MKNWIGLLFLLLLSLEWASADPKMDVAISSTDIHVGDSVSITVTVTGAASADIEFPENIPGLQEVNRIVGFSAVSSLSGDVQTRITSTIVLVPQMAGTFQVPQTIATTNDGQTLTYHAFQIKVAPGDNNPVVTPSPPPTQNQNATNEPSGSYQVPLETNGDPAKLFCHITLDTDKAYIGQSVRLEIQFYIREDVLATQDSIPSLRGSDFLMQPIAYQPRGDELEIGNFVFARETWVTSLTPLKTGDLPIVLDRETNWTPPTDVTSSLFLNPFRRTPTHRDNIPSQTLIMHVQALPTAGRPADFTGAIGNFQIESQADPTRVTVGEPVQLQYLVTGTGNFDRVYCPAIESNNDWKVYPSRAVTQFEDTGHTKGKKEFTMSLIPRVDGTLKIPQPHFSFFNPDTSTYVSLPINLPDIVVLPSTLPQARVSGSAPIITDDTDATAPVADTQLMPNQLSLGNPLPVASLIPIYGNASFDLTLLTTLLILVSTSSMGLWYQQSFVIDRIRYSKTQRQAQSEVRGYLTSLRAAATKRDDMGFLQAARSALTTSLAYRWKVPPDAITRWEIESRAPQLATQLSPLLDTLDQINYSGRLGEALSPENLTAWTGQVEKAVKECRIS